MRAITWLKERGAEFAEISLGETYLRAAGVAVSASPLPYRLDYELDCVERFVTQRLLVRTQGAGWSRRLMLSRDPQGSWGIEASAEGEVDLPGPGGDPVAFATALDCDLGECPVTNTMPVLRHGLLRGGPPRDFVMAWVGVPDLSVQASAQRYTYVGPPEAVPGPAGAAVDPAGAAAGPAGAAAGPAGTTAGPAGTTAGPTGTAAGPTGTTVIRFESGTFSANIVFDSDGLVVDYPGLCTTA